MIFEDIRFWNSEKRYCFSEFSDFLFLISNILHANDSSYNFYSSSGRSGI